MSRAVSPSPSMPDLSTPDHPNPTPGTTAGTTPAPSDSACPAAALPEYLSVRESVRAAGSEDGIVLLHLDSGKYYSLDPVGVLVWQGLAECRSRSEIVAHLQAIFDAPPERVREDAEALLRQFLESGLLRAESRRPTRPAPITPAVPGKHPAAYPSVRMNPDDPNVEPAAGASRVRAFLTEATWFVRGLWALAYIDWRTRRDEFAGIHRAMVEARVDRERPVSPLLWQINAAINRAASFYYRRRWCLQRSAACAYLLRRQGFPVDLVFGVQVLPFIAHAWVECGGQVINDNPELTRSFAVLHRL